MMGEPEEPFANQELENETFIVLDMVGTPGDSPLMHIAVYSIQTD